MTMTFFDASAKLKAGDRVRLTSDYGHYPLEIIPAGATGTVEDNSLNEMQPMLFVKLDQHFKTLDEWDNVLQIYGPDVRFDPEDKANAWYTEQAPVELITTSAQYAMLSMEPVRDQFGSPRFAFHHSLPNVSLTAKGQANPDDAWNDAVKWCKDYRKRDPYGNMADALGVTKKADGLYYGVFCHYHSNS